MSARRFEFVVNDATYPVPGCRFIATLGDYDLDCATGSGNTPEEAIIDWLEMHGLDGQS